MSEFFEVIDVVEIDPWTGRHVGFFSSKEIAERVAAGASRRNPVCVGGIVKTHKFDDLLAELM